MFVIRKLKRQLNRQIGKLTTKKNKQKSNEKNTLQLLKDFKPAKSEIKSILSDSKPTKTIQIGQVEKNKVTLPIKVVNRISLSLATKTSKNIKALYFVTCRAYR